MANRKSLVLIILLAVFTPCIFKGFSHKDSSCSFTAKDMAVPLPAYEVDLPATPTPTPTPVPPIHISEKARNKNPIKKDIDNVDVSITYLELESLGTYYITAYCDCSKCCGVYANGATASGEYCHYSENDYEPTTCAIDRRYHSFGELLWIDGKLYVTEDTGSAVIGKHIDIYLPNHDDVECYGSHYAEVYSARFITTEGRRISSNDYNHYLYDYHLANRNADWNDYGEHF